MTLKEVTELVLSGKATLHKERGERFRERQISEWKEVSKEYYQEKCETEEVYGRVTKKGIKYCKWIGYKTIQIPVFYYYAQEENSHFSIRLNKKVYEKLHKDFMNINI